MYGVMTDESGLYYMRARYYSPEIRRFVNQDILLGGITDGQTLNRYAYVTGRPVSFVDPFGLIGVILTWTEDQVYYPPSISPDVAIEVAISLLEIIDTASDIGYACSILASGGTTLGAFPAQLTKKESIAILVKLLKKYLAQHKFSISKKQWGTKVGKHLNEWGLDFPQDRDKLLSIVNGIVIEADRIVLGDFLGQGPGGDRGPALFFIKGNDVVITTLNGEFVTIMKDGINNTSVKTALKKTLK